MRIPWLVEALNFNYLVYLKLIVRVFNLYLIAVSCVLLHRYKK